MSRSGERGVAILESAVILLAFFVVVLGIMEAGRFLSIQQTLNNAAREGARLAVLPLTGTNDLPTDTQIQNRVQAFLDSNGIQSASVNITRNVAAGGDVFTLVQTSTTYEVLSIAMFSDLEIALSGNARMRNETSP